MIGAPPATRVSTDAMTKKEPAVPNAKPPRLRPDETGKHAVTETPVDLPAQDPDIETFDRKHAQGAPDERRDEQHEKRPEGPYKDPDDAKKQGKIK